MLLITTDGRKAALDIRLVDPSLSFSYMSKVARCAENVFDIYARTDSENGVQLIFCDSSTPKVGFNIYDEMKRILVMMGIPSEKIAFIHDAETERQREQLFLKTRRGDIRILIGSTFKLGLGVNVQNKLAALHHLDIPWRPSDQTQREGRILRQGNENERVEIFRYITEGSFDAYSWQLLETKQRFISGLLSGSLKERSGSDIENTVLNYAEIKALAVGNPLVKQRVETANLLSRYMTLQRKQIESHLALEKELGEIPALISRERDLIGKCREDIVHYRNEYREYDKSERKKIREILFEALCEHVLMPDEKRILRYQGFDVILPQNMIREKPYVWLQHSGRYYVELGDADIGNLIRIDNYLDKLDSHLEKMEDSLTELYVRQKAIKHEISKKDDLADKIEETKKELKRLDERLGV
jgi:hypothetical protein